MYETIFIEIVETCKLAQRQEVSFEDACSMYVSNDYM